MHKYAAAPALVGVLMTAMPLAAFADHSLPMGYESTVITGSAQPMAAMQPGEPASHDCIISSDLGVGSRGEDVRCLQDMLIDDGFLSVSATGYFGMLTRSAVIKWQHEHGVHATGYFGALSRAAFSDRVLDAHTAALTEQNAASTTSGAAHAHVPVDASLWPARPSVSIVLHKDSMSGYNVEIIPTNFRFAPEHVNTAVVPNEGHTHLYVNGKKIARVYGTWFHAGKELFAQGENEVLVTLNANDHSDLAVGGSRVEAKQTVTIN